MKDNTILVLAAEIILAAFGISGLLMGNTAIAYTCVGAMTGVVAGHLNGSNHDAAEAKSVASEEE